MWILCFGKTSFILSCGVDFGFFFFSLVCPGNELLYSQNCPAEWLTYELLNSKITVSLLEVNAYRMLLGKVYHWWLLLNV